MRSFALAATLSLAGSSLACAPVVLGDGGGAGTSSLAPPPGTGGSPAVARAPRLLAAGDTTCWLGAGGHLACWGDNETGELGLGDYVDRRTPTWIPGLSGVIDAAVGAMELCARKADGTVWCWGDDFYGSLDASLPYCESLGAPCTPVPVLSSAEAGGPLAYGDQGFCSTGAAGDVHCWGATPAADVSAYDALSTVIGDDHLCVLFTPAAGQDPTRNVACFGNDDAGQLGTGVGGGGGVAAGGRFVEIAAGADFTCGLDTGGGVWCWGSNQFGELGAGGPTDDSDYPETCTHVACSHTPRLVQGLPPVAHVAAFYVQACAQTVDGHVYCWGTPSHQSPAGAAACWPPAPDCSPTPALVAGVEGATSIAVGNGHACATTGPSEVTCWGLDTHGQLGRGAGADWNPAPLAVPIPPEPM